MSDFAESETGGRIRDGEEPETEDDRLEEGTIVHVDRGLAPAAPRYAFLRPPYGRERSDNIFVPAYFCADLQPGMRCFYKAEEDRQGRMRVSSLTIRDD